MSNRCGLAHPGEPARIVIRFEHLVQAVSRLERYVAFPAPLVAAIVAEEQFVRGFVAAEGDEGARHLLERRVGELAGDVMFSSSG